MKRAYLCVGGPADGTFQFVDSEQTIFYFEQDIVAQANKMSGTQEAAPQNYIYTKTQYRYKKGKLEIIYDDVRVKFEVMFLDEPLMAVPIMTPTVAQQLKGII